jgi:hypothetical protein
LIAVYSASVHSFPGYSPLDLLIGDCLFSSESSTFADFGALTWLLNTMSCVLNSRPYNFLLAELSARRVEPEREIPANSPRDLE